RRDRREYQAPRHRPLERELRQRDQGVRRGLPRRRGAAAQHGVSGEAASARSSAGGRDGSTPPRPRYLAQGFSASLPGFFLIGDAGPVAMRWRVTATFFSDFASRVMVFSL